MSLFSDGMNDGNLAFGKDAGEEFELVRGGRPGIYVAISIDSVIASTALAPGGLKGDTKTVLFILDTVFTASGIGQGSVIIIRGERGRVADIGHDGDNTLILTIESAGARV